MMQTHALVFDLDDTLVETGELWKRAERTLLDGLGLNSSSFDLERFNGCGAREVVQLIGAELGGLLDPLRCLALFEEALLAQVLESPLRLRPGAAAFLERAHGVGPFCIASGSPISVIGAVLERVGLARHFACVVSSSEVSSGKPSPLVFLEASRRLEFAPADCLVLEDSLIGVRAAKAAGMRCFAVPSLESAYREIEALADRTFPSLALITLEAIRSLFLDERMR